MSESMAKAEAAKARAEVVKRNIDSLPPEEKALIGKAAQRFFTHVTFGVAFGSVLGAAIPYRRAWLARMGRASAAARASGSTPTAFYPALGRIAEESARGTAEEAVKQGGFRLPLIARGVMMGLIGGYAGGWIGGATGTWASARLIEREMPGGTERIKVTGLSIQRQLEELAKTGNVPPPLSNNDDTQRFSRPDEIIDDSKRYEWTEAAEERRRSDFAAPAETSSSPESGWDAVQTSRWEELRKSKPSTPSSWDMIRDSSARASLPNDKGRRINSSPRDDEEMRSSSVRGEDNANAAASDKEARRREFEALIERERQGGSDAAESKRWR